ncbi:hypothetical protein BH11PLA2_BH11PLA2_00920 [soil metagenome]
MITLAIPVAWQYYPIMTLVIILDLQLLLPIGAG